ncbi:MULTISPECIES: hypothetical protein [Streptomyces]|uniref:Uncharacterized protein n=1 Tax=Streptomyces cremeus TaxID=66881 RepID=A0ABV5PDW4_STRCM
MTELPRHGDGLDERLDTHFDLGGFDALEVAFGYVVGPGGYR